MRGGSFRFASGFFDLETHSGFPFRWMAREARLGFAPRPGPGFVELSVQSQFGDLSQTLTASAGDGTPQSFEVVRGWNRLSFAVPTDAELLSLATNRSLPSELRPGDDRDLALQVRDVEIHADPERHGRAQERHRARVRSLRELRAESAVTPADATEEVRCAEGCHVLEAGEDVSYRWIERRARLRFVPKAEPRFLEFWLSSPFRDLSQRATVEVGERRTQEHVLAHGRNLLSASVPPGANVAYLELNKALPASSHPGDERELAVQLRSPLLHRDEYRHTQVLLQQANRIRNSEELLSQAVKLSSTPPKLGIDLEGRCNINPPCVYCEWDWNKGLEGQHAYLPFDLEQLRAPDRIFDSAAELINCSIGEPFMIRDIDKVLDAFGRSGKLFEVATNGQILTGANIRRLIGRHIHLYVSIDAATAATYGRLRNNRFESVIDNVQRLIDAKGGPGSLPLVFLVFMPMRANLHEVDAFVEMTAELHADRLALRPLNASQDTNLVWDRGGYHFDYQKELLPFGDLVRVSGRVAELCRAFGVLLSNQLSFGGEVGEQFQKAYQLGRSEASAVLAARASAAAPNGLPQDPADARETVPEASPSATVETAPPPPAPSEAGTVEEDSTPGLVEAHLPICTEPWTSLYVLRRGVLPCCFGGAPIAPMEDFAGAWNSPLVQDIRSALRSGRFHPYCLDSPGCPIVRKTKQRLALCPPQGATPADHDTGQPGERFGFDWPSCISRSAKRVLGFGRRRGRRMLDHLSGRSRRSG